MTDERKTYTGWKVGLALIGGVVLVFLALNLAGLATR